MSIRLLKSAALMSISAVMLSACVSGGYSPAEQELADTLTGSKYQPATREMRNNIETQDLFAQAAFWSREYQLNPADLESAIKLSASVRKMGNPGKAIEIAQTSRALYPRDPYLTAEFAAALIADERANEAIQPLDIALRTTPGYARLWSLKGAALDQAENYDLARKHYARALEITPNDPNVMANVGLSFALQGDANSAEGWLRRAASVPGASSSVHQNLALVMQLQGKTEEAERYAERHLRGTPKSAPTIPQSYQPRPPARAQQQAPARRAAPQANYAPQRPQAAPSLRGYESQSGGAPRTASDAARAAAANRSRVSSSVPGQPSGEQQSVLDRIAQSLGPQASGYAPQQRSPQIPPQMQGGPAPYGAQPPMPPQNYQQQQGYPQMQQSAPAPRGAARRRG